MPGRSFVTPSGTRERYGFNGKDNDNEVKGGGDQQDYGLRIYDPRLGRFLSLDPMSYEYPWYSPYQFAGNKPIVAIDLDGAEEYYKIKQTRATERAALRNPSIEQKVENNIKLGYYRSLECRISTKINGLLDHLSFLAVLCPNVPR